MRTPIATKSHRRPLRGTKTRGKTYMFRVDLIPEDDGRWTADVPDLPGCVTWGNTRSQTLEHAHEAILAYLDALSKRGEPVPSGTAVREAVTVAVKA
jgi:predicted RNase H-like HicB family nuclease